MIVSVGILANAIVVAINDHLVGIALSLSIIGIIFSTLYFLLDGRNKELVNLGEGVLVYLEKEVIFKHPPTIAARGTALYREELKRSPPQPFGIFWKQDQKYLSDAPLSWMQKFPLGIWSSLLIGKHRVIFPLISLVLIASFSFSTIVIMANRSALAGSAPRSQFTVTVSDVAARANGLTVDVTHGARSVAGSDCAHLAPPHVTHRRNPIKSLATRYFKSLPKTCARGRSRRHRVGTPVRSRVLK